MEFLYFGKTLTRSSISFCNSWILVPAYQAGRTDIYSMPCSSYVSTCGFPSAWANYYRITAELLRPRNNRQDLRTSCGQLYLLYYLRTPNVSLRLDLKGLSDRCASHHALRTCVESWRKEWQPIGLSRIFNTVSILQPRYVYSSYLGMGVLVIVTVPIHNIQDILT